MTPARRKLASLSILGVLAAGCGTSEATTTQAEAREQTSVSELDAARSSQTTAVSGLAKPDPGPLRAIFERAPKVLPDCPTGDEKTLRILQGDLEIYSHDFCSAYGHGEARLITDVRGRHYVLLEHFEGHGTRATSVYLTIYGFENGLDQRGRFLIDEPIGFEANATFDYEAEPAPAGGITVSGRWVIQGNRRSDDMPLQRDSAVIEIDTAAAETTNESTR
jgi:hypothetical protein